MGRIKRYATALRRYKRSKGFGIHSPFAFGFVRGVLALRVPYYAYTDIARARSQAQRLAAAKGKHPRVISLKNAKMIHRVVCRFNPMSIIQIGTTYGVSALSAMLVDSRSRMVIYPGANSYPDICSAILAPVAERVRMVSSLTVASAEFGALDSGGRPPMAMVNDMTDAEAATVTDIISDVVTRGGVVIMRNLSHSTPMRRLWDDVTRSMSRGMSFTNGKLGVITALEHLPHQNFSIWF